MKLLSAESQMVYRNGSVMGVVGLSLRGVRTAKSVIRSGSSHQLLAGQGL